MQVCTSLQTDNHASTPPLSFLQTICSSCHPTNSVKALKASTKHYIMQCKKMCLLICTSKVYSWLFVGIPLVYELDKDLQPVKHYYLASDEEVKAAIDKVAAQGKAK